MAEILVKAVDAVHPDPEKDRRGCYKRGMAVVVKPDGHQWGTAEQLPKFWRVKFPGCPASELEKYLAPELDANEDTIRRRVWTLRDDLISSAVLDTLDTVGIIGVRTSYGGALTDVDWSTFRDWIWNFSTEATETKDL